jgi:hypothetical protein
MVRGIATPREKKVDPAGTDYPRQDYYTTEPLRTTETLKEDDALKGFLGSRGLRGRC